MSEKKFEIRKTWRPKQHHHVPPPPKVLGPMEATEFPPTRIFDQMTVIGDSFVVCFVVETTEGLILVDCLYPLPEYLERIESGIREVGLDPADLKAVLFTHGHWDHFGLSDKLREKYGCKIYMCKGDYEAFRTDDDDLSKIHFDPDGFLKEGDTFTLGETTIHVIGTPGHSPDCLSYFIPVTDEGRPHMAALWGGTGFPRKREDQETYLKSAIHFYEKCKEFHADVEISNHPPIDNGFLRLQVCREITEGVANPFVIGEEACQRYAKMFYDFCWQKMDPKPEKEL